MIIVKNRELLIPNHERYIGTTYDDNSTVRTFRISRFNGDGMDKSQLDFYVIINYDDGTDPDAVGVVKSVSDDYIVLEWDVGEDVTDHPGCLYLWVRGFDHTGTVRWSSFPGVFYIEESGTAPTDLSDLEQRISEEDKLIRLAKLYKCQPMTAATVSEMTDRESIYVYVGSEDGYTYGNWYFWDEDESAWVSGGVYNSIALQTDTELIAEGVAADAKAVGDKFTDLENQLDGDPYQMPYIKGDGSGVAWQYSFVTPEMYGAYKDNNHDDAVAIQSALDFAESNNIPVILSGFYYTQTQIRIGGESTEGGKNITVCGESASIIYSGTGSAVLLQCINGADIFIGDIHATSGNCIEFNSSVGRADRTQYVNLQFNHLVANSTDGCCIKVSVSDVGWSNQNVVTGGQMAGGKYGIYILSAGQGVIYEISNWVFNNIGFEGTENNIYLDGSANRIKGIIFNNIRFAEFLNTAKLFTLIGSIYNLTYNSRFEIKVSDLNIATGATLGNCTFNCSVVDENRSQTIGYGYYASYSVRRLLNYFTNTEKEIIEKNGTSTSNTLTLTEYTNAGSCRLRINNGIAILDISGLQVNVKSNDLVAVGGIPDGYRPKTEMSATVVTVNGESMRVWCRTNGSVAFSAPSVDATKVYFGQLIYYYN